MGKVYTVKDVKPEAFVVEFAKYLKRSGKIEVSHTLVDFYSIEAVFQKRSVFLFFFFLFFFFSFLLFVVAHVYVCSCPRVLT